jgi:hypothetical protein
MLTFLRDIGYEGNSKSIHPMNKKSSSSSAFFNLRALIALLLCGAAARSFLTMPLLAFFGIEAPARASHKILTFEERVAYQRSIEQVYWHHRIWPKTV